VEQLVKEQLLTSSLVFSGSSPGPPISADTEFWNGTTWTEVNNTAVQQDLMLVVQELVVLQH
jgi:hypothetical protein